MAAVPDVVAKTDAVADTTGGVVCQVGLGPPLGLAVPLVSPGDTAPVVGLAPNAAFTGTRLY